MAIKVWYRCTMQTPAWEEVILPAEQFQTVDALLAWVEETYAPYQIRMEWTKL